MTINHNIIKQFNCPYCDKRLNVEINTFYLSRRINCSNCNKDFIILNNCQVIALSEEQQQSLLDNDTLYARTKRRKNNNDIVKKLIEEGKKNESYIKEMNIH